MRRFILSVISIITLYILQTTLFSTAFSLGGISPNLLLMFTCIAGFMRGRKAGLFTGFFCGLLIDFMNGGIIGFTPIMLLYIGYFNGIYHKEYSKEHLLLPISLVAFCDLFSGVIFYIFNYLIRNRLDFGYYLVHIILPEVVYTVMVTIFAYIFVYYVNNQLDILSKKRQAKNVGRQNS